MSPPSEPRGRPVTPFVILFEGRTGSTYLVEALDRHPEVRARKEVFASLRNQGWLAEHQVEWLEEYLGGPPEEEGIRAVGFKTKLRDVLDPEETARVLEEVGASAIVLLRRNRIKHLVSVFNAMRLHEETGDWNLYADGGSLPPLEIDPERFDEWLQARERQREELEGYVERLALPTLRLTYEDLLLEEGAFFEQLFDFLGVAPRPVEGEARKATSDDLREALANFEELRARYEGTRYEPMFDEVLVGEPEGERA